MNPNQRRFKRRPLTDRVIPMRVTHAGESRAGRIINISFQGIAVALPEDFTSDLNGRDVNLALPDFTAPFPETGRVMAHERGAGGMLHVYLPDISQAQLAGVLRLFYPDAGRHQLTLLARQLKLQVLAASGS